MFVLNWQKDAHPQGGLLARDLDGDGKITDSRELFGGTGSGARAGLRAAPRRARSRRQPGRAKILDKAA
jgi:hypothetical protein